MGTLVYSKIENKFSPTLPHPHWGETGADRWSDWVWQQQNRVRTLDQLAEVFHLTAGEVSATKETRQVFQFAVTPYYLSLMDPENPDCPIRRQAIPQPGELKILPQELLDPSKEDSMTPRQESCIVIQIGLCSTPLTIAQFTVVFVRENERYLTLNPP